MLTVENQDTTYTTCYNISLFVICIFCTVTDNAAIFKAQIFEYVDMSFVKTTRDGLHVVWSEHYLFFGCDGISSRFEFKYQCYAASKFLKI